MRLRKEYEESPGIDQELKEVVKKKYGQIALQIDGKFMSTFVRARKPDSHN